MSDVDRKLYDVWEAMKSLQEELHHINERLNRMCELYDKLNFKVTNDKTSTNSYGRTTKVW